MITWVILFALFDTLILNELSTGATPAVLLIAALPFSVIGLIRGLRLLASLLTSVHRDKPNPVISDLLGFCLFATLQILVLVLTHTQLMPLDDFSVVVAAVASVFLPKPTQRIRPLPMTAAILIVTATAVIMLWSMVNYYTSESRALQRAFDMRQAFTVLLSQPPYSKLQSGRIRLPVTSEDFSGEALVEVYSDRINQLPYQELWFVRYREEERIVLIVLASVDEGTPQVISIGVSWSDSSTIGNEPQERHQREDTPLSP